MVYQVCFASQLSIDGWTIRLSSKSDLLYPVLKVLLAFMSHLDSKAVY